MLDSDFFSAGKAPVPPSFSGRFSNSGKSDFGYTAGVTAQFISLELGSAAGRIATNALLLFYKDEGINLAFC
jgi:hypothetical protein